LRFQAASPLRRAPAMQRLLLESAGSAVHRVRLLPVVATPEPRRPERPLCAALLTFAVAQENSEADIQRMSVIRAIESPVSTLMRHPLSGSRRPKAAGRTHTQAPKARPQLSRRLPSSAGPEPKPRLKTLTSCRRTSASARTATPSQWRNGEREWRATKSGPVQARTATAEYVNALACHRELQQLPLRGLAKVRAVAYLHELAKKLMRMAKIAPQLIGRDAGASAATLAAA